MLKFDWLRLLRKLCGMLDLIFFSLARRKGSSLWEAARASPPLKKIYIYINHLFSKKMNAATELTVDGLK